MQKEVKFLYENYIQSLKIVSIKNKNNNVEKLIKNTQKHYEIFLVRNEDKNIKRFCKIIEVFLSLQ